jgi:hypothetical protein
MIREGMESGRGGTESSRVESLYKDAVAMIWWAFDGKML